ncbi:MAG: GNAT family N-acetyltransferase [Pseudomonadota bacterium]
MPTRPLSVTALPPSDTFDRWAEVHALLLEAFAFMERRIDPPSSLTQMGPEALAEKAASATVLIAEDEGRIVACAFLADEPPALSLSKVAVALSHRGRGLSRVLIDRAVQDAKMRGLDRLRLQSRVELTETHAAFAALGFAETGRTAHPGYTRPTSITMERHL